MKVIDKRTKNKYAAKIYSKEKFDNHQNKSRFMVIRFNYI